jgi:outer membrane receptor for ferrienterochelin and colicins
VPSLRQTVGDWGQSSRGGNIYGNPDLKPETSLTKEIGVLYDSGAGTTAGLTVFDNEFEDKITRVACPSCGPLNSSGRVPTTNINVDNAITRGLEASLGTQPEQDAAPEDQLHLHQVRAKSGEFAGMPLNQLPRHLFNVSLDWSPTAQLNGWLKASYRGEESAHGRASSGSFTQKSYTMLDLGGSYKLNKTVTLYAGIYNLLDKQVIYDGVNYDTVLDGRRYWLGMNVKF